MACVGAMGSAIVLYVGGRDVLAGTASPRANLVTFLFYVGMFYEPVAQLHQINQLYQAGRASSERVAEILDAATEDYGDAKAAVRASCAWPGRLSHVEFAYRSDVPALHDHQCHGARRASAWRWSGRPARANRRWWRCSAAFTRRPAARFCSMGAT